MLAPPGGPISDPTRARARAFAQQSIDEADPVGWFDRLYEEAEAGQAVVSWDDRAPNPHLVRWLDGHPEQCRGRALDVGCGFGDNAEELARRGLDVTAFDVSAAAIRGARARFPRSGVRYLVADGRTVRGQYDLVTETYTLQVLPQQARAELAAALRRCVAPGGRLVVIARGRDAHEPAGALPWPLTLAEVRLLGGDDLVLEGLDDFMDDESQPVRRVVATFMRPGGQTG